MADHIADPQQPLKALFVAAGNPLLSIGGEERMREAFKGLELVVAIDLYRNATGELADYVLPAADMFERPDINITGLGLQHRPYVQYTDAVVAPRYERREEWWIFGRLCQALGLKSPLDHPEPNPWGRIDHMLRSRGHSLDELKATPYGIDFGAHDPGTFYTEHLQTPDQKVDCCPPGFAPALEQAEVVCAELEREAPDQLKLIHKRDIYMHNSWYANVPAMKRGARDRNYLFMHPGDAESRGFADGDVVRVASDWGALEIELQLEDDLMPGVVAMTHGWGHQSAPGMRFAQKTAGVNMNRLLPTGPGSFDPLSNQSHMTGIAVSVTGR
jgi:anaerobic selenocysteine-containing dehydrogenase